MISVLVPCLNEEGGLLELERRLFPALESLQEDFEVLIVDDGSTDGTWKNLSALAARQSKLRLFRHEINLGIGASLKTGIAQARGDWLVFLDADLTFDPARIEDLIAAQKKTGADCVSGSPMLGGMPGVPFGRRLPSLLLNAFYRGLIDRRLTAFTPMFRLYRLSDLRALQLRTNGFEVSVEVLALLRRSGKSVAEIPTPLSSRTTGSSKLRRWRELKAHLLLAFSLLAAPPGPHL